MNRYIRHGIAKLEEVIPAVLTNWSSPSHLRKKLLLQGYKVGTGSLRLVTFAKAYKDGKICCVECGLEASFFSIDSFQALTEKPSIHLNLYGIRNGQEVLFTHDHILARALGGIDDLSNTQVMCSPCNNKKSRMENKLATQMRLEKDNQKGLKVDQKQE